MKNHTKTILLSAVVIFMAGCATTAPTYEHPTVNTPAWSVHTTHADTQIAQNWWRAFNDDQLNTLMETALDYNHDLKAAMTRIAQSRAALKIVSADLFPSASATASYMNTSPQAMNITDMRNNGIPNYTAGLGISYELDLFGKNESKRLSTEESLYASQYQKDALVLVIMGDVAQNYFNVLSLKKRLILAKGNLATTRDLLKVAKVRFATGGGTQLNITRTEGEIAKAKAQVTALEQNIALAQNALAVLTGTPPQSFTLEYVTLDKLSLPNMALIQPAELLERRPDIKAAEARLKENNADIDAAKAAFYPSMTISPSLLLATSPSAAALSILSSIYAPLFTGGELKGKLDKVTAEQQEALHIYKQTVLNAFKEAQNALISAQKTQEREKQLQQATNSTRKAYNLAKDQYELSIIDFRDVLNIHRELLQLQDDQEKARYETLAARVDLFKAMGGGWRKGHIKLKSQTMPSD